MKTKVILALLIGVIIVESTALSLSYLDNLHPYRTANLRRSSQSVSFPFAIFDKPISSNTEHDLDPKYFGSWEVDILSSLVPSSNNRVTEAEMALAPDSTSESTSIPTLIVQERADGLLRVEDFAQSWPNTYGLLLYNSSSPGWTSGTNVTIIFRSFGPPSAVNPQLAPRPNGNVDILVGGVTVLSNYPIAWANLSDVYLYGYPGSSFTGGMVQISFYEVSV